MYGNLIPLLGKVSHRKGPRNSYKHKAPTFVRAKHSIYNGRLKEKTE